MLCGGMRKSFLTLAAVLFSSPALANTLIDNVNGIEVGPGGTVQHFRALLVDETGKVIRPIPVGEVSDLDVQHRIDEHGATMLPGLIDAHGHVIESSGGDIGLGLM